MKRFAWFVLPAITAVIAAAMPAAAARVSWPTDQNLTINGITLVIGAGSQADRFQFDDKSVTVGVAPGDMFTLRSSAPQRHKLANDAGLAECYVPANQSDNAVILNGPLTVTITPSDELCNPPALDPSGVQRTPPQLGVTVALPNGRETMKAGDNQPVLWSTNGNGVVRARLKLSTDGGLTYPTVVAESLENTGSYTWIVPLMTTTTTARLRVEALDGYDRQLYADNSNADFTINGTDAPVPPPTPAPPAVVALTRTGPYSAADELAATADISADKGLATAAGAIVKCVAGTLLKASTPSVYYCGTDGKRHVFLNTAVFNTWYADFSGVATVSDADLAAVSLGGNVTYRPGKRLVKITTDPKVYAVSRGSILRWVETEALAAQLYGADWVKMVDDVPDSFFVNYVVGEPIAAAK